MQVIAALSFQIGFLSSSGVSYIIQGITAESLDISFLILGVIMGLAAGLLAVLWYIW